MALFRQVVLLALCGSSCALVEGPHARRFPSGEGHGPRRIGPSGRQIAFAAIPLPIVQVFARMPPGRLRRPAPAPPAYEHDLQPHASAYAEAHFPDAGELRPSEWVEERPDRPGGFTPRPARGPIVFRIHKYKITRE